MNARQREESAKLAAVARRRRLLRQAEACPACLTTSGGLSVFFCDRHAELAISLWPDQSASSAQK